jgi:hypothetical protein
MKRGSDGGWLGFLSRTAHWRNMAGDTVFTCRAVLRKRWLEWLLQIFDGNTVLSETPAAVRPFLAEKDTDRPMVRCMVPSGMSCTARCKPVMCPYRCRSRARGQSTAHAIWRHRAQLNGRLCTFVVSEELRESTDDTKVARSPAGRPPCQAGNC